jgi:hypothetical protein
MPNVILQCNSPISTVAPYVVKPLCPCAPPVGPILGSLSGRNLLRPLWQEKCKNSAFLSLAPTPTVFFRFVPFPLHSPSVSIGFAPLVRQA